MSKAHKLRILILSTHHPSYLAGLGRDVMHCLKDAGHKVDFLSLYTNEVFRSDYKCIKPKSRVRLIGSRLCPAWLKSFRRKHSKRTAPRDNFEKLGMVFNDDYEIHYPDENQPGLDIEQLLEHINGEYDLVITLWWFNFINTTSLKAVYDKLHCPIMILSIDMAPMTGGCFYFNQCRRFEHGCGECPAIKSTDPYDFTNRNYILKKNNYNNINCAFLGNSWMNQFAIRSNLFKGSNTFKINCIIDENEFKPIDKGIIRKELNISCSSVVLFARSSKELRKGCKFLVYALNNLPESIVSKVDIVLISVGDEYLNEHVQSNAIQHRYLGRINRPELIKYYQAADFFLSPSIDDAGPSMVNQAQMCGTPVICFNNGTAVDVVINGKSGFKTDDISEQGFSEILDMAIERINKDPFFNENLRISTRKIALETCSKACFASKILEYYNEMIIKKSDM